MVTDRPSPVDTLLDLFVYAPVGLALLASEELPKLAAKGRAQIGGQLNMARVLGQFAVAQGRRQMASHRSSADPPGRRPERGGREPTPNTGPGETGDSTSAPVADAVRPSDLDRPSGGQAAGPGRLEGEGLGAASPEVPGPSGLAIPGYDSLAASQVVPRLAGLSAEELAAVGAYESAHRARRTILTRIQQLQER
jgi:hypothetical protein